MFQDWQPFYGVLPPFMPDAESMHYAHTFQHKKI